MDAVLAGDEPCLGWGFASPWEHGWPCAACAKVQMPCILSQGICRALSGGLVPLGNELGFLEVHFHDTWSRAQGPGAAISCCTLLFKPKTPAWHTLSWASTKPLMHLQGISSAKGLQKAYLHLLHKSEFFSGLQPFSFTHYKYLGDDIGFSSI